MKGFELITKVENLTVRGECSDYENVERWLRLLFFKGHRFFFHCFNWQLITHPH